MALNLTGIKKVIKDGINEITPTLKSVEHKPYDHFVVFDLKEKTHLKLMFQSDGKIEETIRLSATHLLEILTEEFKKYGKGIPYGSSISDADLKAIVEKD